MKLKRSALAALAVVGLVASSLAVVATTAGAAAEKVTICHRTNSNTNPYVEISPSANGVLNGHAKNHDDLFIWNDQLKGQGQKWGDIIPAFDDYPGLNLTTEGTGNTDGITGAQILANHCKIPGTEPQVGTLGVTKDVVSGSVPEGTTVIVAVTCTGFAEPVELEIDANGGYDEIAGIQAGSVCTADETDGAGATNTTYTPTNATQTIEANTTKNVTVHNTYSGTITVFKDVASPGAPAGNVTVHLDCDGTSYDQDLFISAGGGSDESSDIPTGTECTVTETNDQGATLVSYSPNGGSSTTPPTVTVGSGTTVEVTVTNTYSGTITVFKDVASGTVPAGNVTVHLDCDGTSYDQDLFISAGGNDSAESSDIPTGTECTVTETGQQGATLVSYSPDGGTSTTPPTVTVGSGTTVEVTVTNTYPTPETPAGPEVAPAAVVEPPAVAPAAVVAAANFTG